MERLTYRKDGKAVNRNCYDWCATCTGAECLEVQRLLDRLAAYEDSEEQGLLVRLPCKAGDTVYVIRHTCDTEKRSIQKGEVINFMLGDGVVLVVDYNFFGIEEGYFKWGYNAFATKEEAEAALKEG